MPIELKIRKIGNSYGVVLPKEALQHLKVEEGQSLYLTEAPEDSYRVVKGDDAFQSQMAEAEELIKRYRNTFRELAK